MRFQSRFTSRFEPTRFQSRFDVGRDTAFRSQGKLSDGLFFRALFRDGGKGALLSSAAPSANWQTNAGATLAGFGDPVGLALDTKTGLALGPELASLSLSSFTAGGDVTFAEVDGAIEMTRGAGGIGSVVNLAAAIPTGGSTAQIVMEISKTAGPGGNRVFVGPVILLNGPNIDQRPEILAGSTMPIWCDADTTIRIHSISIREIPGAHFSTSVTADRLTRGREPLGGVRNLLDASEDFASPWFTQSSSLTVDSGVALINVTSGSDSGLRTQALPASPGQEYTLEVDASAQVGTWELRLQYFNGASFVGQSGPATIAATGSALQRYKRSGVIPAGADTVRGYVRSTSGAGSQCLVAKPQLELGSTATAYQSRTTINDVTEPGVPDVPFYRFDGVSDRLEGNATARDILKDAPGAEAHAAIRWDGGVSPVIALSTDTAVSRFQLQVESNGALRAFVRRTDGDASTQLDTAPSVVSAGVKVIVGLSVDYLGGGASAIKIWRNGVVIATATLTGTGNTSNTQSLRARLGSNISDFSFFKGQIFREIPFTARVLGAAERSAMLARLATLTGVTL